MIKQMTIISRGKKERMAIMENEKKIQELISTLIGKDVEKLYELHGNDLLLCPETLPIDPQIKVKLIKLSELCRLWGVIK